MSSWCGGQFLVIDEVRDFFDVLCRMNELERNSLAVTAGREAPALMAVTSCSMPGCCVSCVMR